MPRQIDPSSAPWAQSIVENVHPHVAIVTQGRGGSEQENETKQVPLQFKVSVRTERGELFSGGLRGGQRALLLGGALVSKVVEFPGAGIEGTDEAL